MEEAHQILEDLQANMNCPDFKDIEENKKRSIAIYVAKNIGFSSGHAHLWFDGRNKKIEAILRKIIKKEPYPGSVLISGDVGTGKTSYLSAMLKGFLFYFGNNLLGRGYQVPFVFSALCEFINHNELLDIIHNELRQDIHNHPTFGDIKRKAILLIDDIGTGSEGEFNTSKIEELIDHRWSHNLTTWITTNISGEDFKIKTGWERAYSRFTDKNWMTYLEIKDVDRRK